MNLPTWQCPRCLRPGLHRMPRRARRLSDTVSLLTPVIREMNRRMSRRTGKSRIYPKPRTGYVSKLCSKWLNVHRLYRYNQYINGSTAGQIMKKPSEIKPAGMAGDNRAAYRSGVAARLAGLSAETLRVWERRYGLSDTQRSTSGQRLYSAEHVRRLGLLKQLVDQGHAIGVLA